jgi:hypothetical protein
VPDETDAVIDRVSRTLRDPVRLSPGFDARVMAAVRAAARPPAGRGALAWLVRPRTVRLSPLAALALAAGLAGLAVLGGRQSVERAPGPGGDRGAPVPGAARLVARAPALEPTRFVLHAPDAGAVALVGQFNDWDPTGTPLAATGDGGWAAVVPLAAGRYEYAFLVDGARVVPDPRAPELAPSEFGVPNSVVVVGGGLP